MTHSEILKLKRIIWDKARVVPEYDKNQVRKDACGAWIVYSQFGDRTKPFGWEIDHICPESILKRLGVPQSKIDNVINLRPLHWRNNASKGNDYPSYIASVTAEKDRNRLVDTPFEVNSDLQMVLNHFFNTK